MKKTTIILLVVLAAVLIVAASIRFFSGEDNWICANGEWVKHGNPSVPKPATRCGQEDQKLIGGDTDEHGCLAAAGYSWCEARKKCLRQWEEICDIKIETPLPDEIIASPLQISGQAIGNWYFEAVFPIKLLDANGKEIARISAQAQSDWMTGEPVPFKATLEFENPQTATGTLVFEKDNPSGLPENSAKKEISVRFAAIKKLSVKIFLSNSKYDPGASDCSKTFAVERVVPETKAVARAALEQLLAGPTEQEKEQGFFTSINPGVEIKKLTIENEIAKVEFSEKLEEAVGGSCRVAAIRSQINETLKQFPTVKNVVISINGRTEDILQP